MLECAFLKCAFLLMPFSSRSQGGHPGISLIVRPEVAATCTGGCRASEPSSPSMVYKDQDCQTAALAPGTLLFLCSSVSAVLQWQLLQNCLLHWAVQDTDWKVAYGLPCVLPVSWPHPLLLGLMSRQPVLFHACARDIPALWASPALSPCRSCCSSLSQPADRQEAVLCRSLLFYAASHCTGLETASRAKEAEQRHQHLLHICPPAQLSPRWGWNQKT